MGQTSLLCGATQTIGYETTPMKINLEEEYGGWANCVLVVDSRKSQLV
jgi:hypothetical protein